jgi:hypothetical protein
MESGCIFFAYDQQGDVLSLATKKDENSSEDNTLQL